MWWPLSPYRPCAGHLSHLGIDGEGRGTSGCTGGIGSGFGGGVGDGGNGTGGGGGTGDGGSGSGCGAGDRRDWRNGLWRLETAAFEP
jgi:hypothetical protein